MSAIKLRLPLPVIQRRKALSRDEIFHILSNERRRRVLEHIENEREPVEVTTLVDAVAAAEAAGEQGELDNTSSHIRSSVYSALVQTHLPAMEEAGVIEYDQDDQVVSPTDNTRDVQLYLEYSPSHDIPWAEYYLGLSAVCAGLVTVTWFSIYPFVLMSEIGIAGAIVLVFLVSSMVHVAEIRTQRIGG